MVWAQGQVKWGKVAWKSSTMTSLTKNSHPPTKKFFLEIATQRGENAQPLIDQRVNFSCLRLWLVSFLQIISYYEQSEVVAKAIYVLNFCSGIV